MKSTINNNTVVVINGSGGVGKGEFVNFCTNYCHKVMKTSMVDYAKSIARYADWNGIKTEKDRLMLSNLKDTLDEWNDCSFKYVSKYINACKNKIIFVDAREPCDITRLVNEFNAITLFLSNPNVPLIESNHADRDVKRYNYDYYINNDGTLEDLKDSAEAFLQEISNG